MMAGWNAEANEPNAHHIAEDGNDDDNANTEVHCDSFSVEWRIEVFQNVKSDEGAQCGHRSVDNHWN